MIWQDDFDTFDTVYDSIFLAIPSLLGDWLVDVRGLQSRGNQYAPQWETRSKNGFTSCTLQHLDTRNFRISSVGNYGLITNFTCCSDFGCIVRVRAYYFFHAFVSKTRPSIGKTADVRQCDLHLMDSDYLCN